MAATETRWENRIVGRGDEAPADLIANPRNYRRHPENQRQALREMLDNVGWVQQVVVNKRTGHLVDGHLRVELAAEDQADTVPVLYVDLSEEEEGLVLAALDPLSALAVHDSDQLQALLDTINFDGDALTTMFEDLGGIPDLDLDPSDTGEGDSLEGLDVTMAEPRHQPAKGEAYQLGPHVLYVGSVHHDWAEYEKYMVADAVFAPYPTPMLAVMYDKGALVMVQPDTYLAGHVLDKWESKNGAPVKL